MLHSVLLHLSGDRRSQAVIECGVALAQRYAARVRGVTLLDTRRLASLTSGCEAAVYVSGEFGRLDRLEQQQVTLRERLTRACLSAGVDFDVRRMRGDPLEVLTRESHFHDLIVTGAAPPDDSPEDEASDVGLSGSELIDLLLRGAQPMMVVREKRQLGRVLLVYDGAAASGRAVRHFLSQNLLPQAEFRLLGVGQADARARNPFGEMADYCRSQVAAIESGALPGTLRRVLVPYACKWEADLIVLGVSRGNRLLRRVLGEAAQDVLRNTACALYATT
jgi:nucleotide-binding universal stress UspA family protein